MSRVVPSSTQKSAAEKMANAISRIKGSEAEVVERASGTRSRWTVSIKCDPENWRGLAEKLSRTHEVDYCSMITGIHWAEGPPERSGRWYITS